MYNIVENPETKELFLAGNCTHEECRTNTIAFDGTPISQNIENWRVVGQAPNAQAWLDEPGKYGTLYGSMTIAMLDGDKWIAFDIGETIAYLRNWVKDASENDVVVSVANQKAYSSRNVARSKATYN
jgi:hypothetical protein